MKPNATSGSQSGGGGTSGGKEDRRTLYQRDLYYDPDMDRGRPGYNSSRERRHDHEDAERERRRRDYERAEAEMERRRRDPDREEAERERRRRDPDREEAERERRRRDLHREEAERERRRCDPDREEAERERTRRNFDWEEMKREQRRRDREDKEKEGDNDNERRKKWEKDKEREKNRMTEDAMGKDRNRGKEDDTNKDGDQGSKRKRRWNEVGDNGGSSTFAVMATHPTAPLASIALRPGVPEPSPPSLGVSRSEKVSECILLENVFDGCIRREDAFYLVARDKIHRSSARCGPIQHIYVDRKGFVYLRFYDKTTAADAKKKWHESVYEGSVITAKFMDAVKYRSRFPLQ